MPGIICVILSLAVSLSCFSQRVFYSNTKVVTLKTNSTIIGEIKNHVLVWTTRIRDERPEVLVLNSEMQLLKKVKLDGYKNLKSPQFYFNENSFYVATRQTTKNAMLFKVMCFDENASLLSETVIDSIPKDTLSAFVFKFLQAPDKKTICFIKASLDTKTNILTFTCKFYENGIVTTRVFGLPFDYFKDHLVDFSMDEHKNIYFLKTREINNTSYTIELSKGLYNEQTVLFAQKSVNNNYPKDLHLITGNGKCIVFGIFIKDVAYISNASEKLNTVYVWQTGYSLEDAPGDSLITTGKGAEHLKNVTAQNLPTSYFYTSYDTLLPDVATRIRTEEVYAEPILPVRLFDENGGIRGAGPGITQPNRSQTYTYYDFNEYSTALTKKLAIFRLLPDNSTTLPKAFEKSGLGKEEELFSGAMVIRKADKTHVIYPVKSGKNRFLVEYVSITDDGKETKTPVTAWKGNYNYRLNQSVETGNSLIIPCQKGERIYFAKIVL